jgi:acetolactate synthase-1/2/3 large subunit
MSKYRPVVLLGNGVRGNGVLIDFFTSLNIPLLTTWMGADLIPEDHPNFCGRPGIFGQRAANIIQQKATHFISVGARLDGEQVAYAYDRFAPNAEMKLAIDSEQSELDKLDDTWKKVCGNVKFADAIGIDPADGEWLAWCKALYKRYRYELAGVSGGKYIDPFYLMRLLGDASNSDDVFAIGSSGNAPTTFFQSFKIRQGQRVSNVSTIGAMGADIPMALGAAMATGSRVICVTGDGGFQLNTQELETIHRYHLPVIFFVMNNNGYNSIRTMQKARFEGRLMGCDPTSGLTLPRLEDIAEAYRFSYMPLWGGDTSNFDRCFGVTPMIVEVFVDPDWQQMPRVMASIVDGELRTDDMQDMSPKLDNLEELML